MTKLSETQRKKLVNKTFGVVQAIVGLGLPVDIGILRFETFNSQFIQKRQRKGPKKSFKSTYDKDLLMNAKLLKKGAYGKFTVGKISITETEIKNSIQVLTTR